MSNTQDPPAVLDPPIGYVDPPPGPHWCTELGAHPAACKVLGNDGAAPAVAGLEQGGRVLMVTRGQWSLLDLMRAVADIIGPAAWSISTWTVSAQQIEALGWMMAHGQITSIRFLLDKSYRRTKPQWAARMVELFGAHCMVESRNHAKFATMRNQAWNVSIRTSANLNSNPRMEHFDVEDDATAAAFLDGVFDELFALLPGAYTVERPEVYTAWASFLKEPPPPLDGVTRVDNTTGANRRGVADVNRRAVGPGNGGKASGEVPRVSTRGARQRGRGPELPIINPGTLAPTIDPSEFDREQYLRWEIGRLALAVERGDLKSVAYGTALKTMRTAHAELSALLLARDADPAELTEEELREHLEAKARSMPAPHLEIFVRVYLEDRPTLELRPRLRAVGE